MSRYYAPISKDDFLERVKRLMADSDDGDIFVYDPAFERSKAGKDLQKVQFDWENYTRFDETAGYCTYPVGYRDLGNGLHVFFVNAGGDWEIPLCFVFYWDGSVIRAYIPNDGNAYHKAAKAAYGSVADGKSYDPERDGEDPDNLTEAQVRDIEASISEEKLIADIRARIQPR